jgi:hypothetical protein
MFKKKDAYSFSLFRDLVLKPDVIGNFFVEYQVTKYDDIQIKDFQSLNIKNTSQKYLIHCTQKINIFNQQGLDVSPIPYADSPSFENYPVLINTFIYPEKPAAAEGLDIQLLQYSPQTVNTKIQQSGSSAATDGKTSGTSVSNTVGSSTSETNSYGVSISVGLSEQSDSMSANYEHSTTETHDRSSTQGRDYSRSQSREDSSSSMMSIKDWGSYALVNPTNKAVVWTFGQEYPWDAIKCRTEKAKDSDKGNKKEIIVPPAMAARLYDTTENVLYPPSELSMFGINFVMKALWLITIDNYADDEVTFKHVVNYFSGSHFLDGTVLSVYIDKQETSLRFPQEDSLETKIDTALLALDPVDVTGRNPVIGFIPGKFLRKPSPLDRSGAKGVFKIISTANDLLIRDTTTYPEIGYEGLGFTAVETGLLANFSAKPLPLSMTLYFKITDNWNEYTLFVKHWKTGDASSTGVKLSIVINGDADATIVKYVDALEAEGGENNLLSINLRNLDYATVDYHDYLQLGVNTIEITLRPIDPTGAAQCGYQIRGISIEKT